MTDRQRAASIVALLKEEYAVAECTLDYEDAWQLLVAVRLAAQCTDERVNVVTEKLFSVYHTPQKLADAPVENIEKIVRPCGLGNTKARDIKLCMTRICREYGGFAPSDFEELLSLPGVGRKSANLIMGDIFKKPAIVADTHCIRLSNRFGLCSTRDPKKVELALKKLVEPSESNDFCHRLVLHGRAVCTARSPSCERCRLFYVCKRAGVD